MAEQPFDEAIRSATCGLHQPSQQKPGRERKLYQERHCQFELTGTQNAECNEGRLADFLDLTGPDHSALDYKHILFFKESGKDFQGNSEIIRAATPSSGSVCRVVSSPSVSKGGPGLRVPAGPE